MRRRAALLARIRRFFDARGVLEVETPLLSAGTVTDPHLHSLSVDRRPGEARFYLQTSPEFAMKRLLAAGSGPIYQVCKAFRADESGRRHNLEFTLLEWYRPGFDHHRLMDEMDAFLAATLGAEPAERLTYGRAFERHLGFDPHTADLDRLRQAAQQAGIDAPGFDGTRDDWLHLLASHGVEPELGRASSTSSTRTRARTKTDGPPFRPTFLYEYPASQAALARVRPAGVDPAGRPTPAVAERFEVYVEGVELANGFHELTDADEQRRRFEADREQRRRLGLEVPPVDERLLAALAAGLPDCAGVALGVDRLAMLASGADHIDQVLTFPSDRA